MSGKLIRTLDTIITLNNENLGFYATLHGEGLRSREEKDNPSDFRGDFQHDRDRIIHSRSFRRLKHKTQVFLALEGDHYRTRLTHTLEVAQLARTIARALALNEDLCEAIALGHDLGHTPFGHTGEVLLHKIMKGHDPLDGLIPENIRYQLGGFKHNYQSLRVVDFLEKRYDYEGLNLTDKVRAGILMHTSLKPDIQYENMDLSLIPKEKCFFLESQAVAMADEIAQQTHDLEDGIRSNLISAEEALKLKILQPLKEQNESNPGNIKNIISRYLINFLVLDVIYYSEEKIWNFLEKNDIKNHDEFNKCLEKIPVNLIAFSQKNKKEYMELRHFVYQSIINSSKINRLEGKAKFFIRKLFKAYMNNPLQLPDYMLSRYARLRKELSLREQPFAQREKIIQRYRQRPDFIRLICDYIAGMTDSFAMDEFRNLYLPIS